MATSQNCKVFYREGGRLKWACESYNPVPCENMAERLRRSRKVVMIVYAGQVLTSEMIAAWRRNGR